MKKKLVAALLVAILASAAVFAGFSGNATVSAFYNLDDDTYGFANKEIVNFEIALSTEDVDKKAEGDIYAEIKATLSLSITDKDADGVASGDPIGSAGTWDGVAIKPIADITEAKVAGENWYVSILGCASRLDLATSAIDTWKVKNEMDDYGRLKKDYTKKASYAVANNKAPGVEVGIAGYSVSVGLVGEGDDEDKLAYTVHAKTPAIEVAEGLKVQAGVAANKKAAAGEKSNFGGSVKVAYAKDAFAATVASDMGYSVKDEQFDADVAAEVKYDFVKVEGYYATNVKVNGTAIENLLSARATFDLNAFDLPLTVKVTGKNLINEDAQDLSASVTYKADTYSAEVGGGYKFASKEWNAYLKGNADIDIFNIYAGAKFLRLTAETSLSSPTSALRPLNSFRVLPSLSTGLATTSMLTCSLKSTVPSPQSARSLSKLSPLLILKPAVLTDSRFLFALMANKEDSPCETVFFV
jgi:hypothetical protein